MKLKKQKLRKKNRRKMSRLKYFENSNWILKKTEQRKKKNNQGKYIKNLKTAFNFI